ncbi:MAG TPA: alpha/beta fold hydrolase [Rhizomicrobium sp.]|jgi:pimeloyl-ACP methyl ester carboxylesterase
MVRACFAVLCLCFAATSLAAAPGGATIRVGSLVLTKCIRQYDGYCGTLVRPLDPDGHISGKITIGFEFYPHTDTQQDRRGVIIAQEGGPGYSTTGSRDGYVRLFTPLRNRRDIVLVDKRGTGRSGAIHCRGIQKGGGLEAVRACGSKLGDTAWLYSSDFAADDVAAVLTALDIDKVDYYGDSYGTYFGEVFAARHPDRLRTVVLDSAYPVNGDGPYFRSEIENGPVAFAIACRRTPSCNAFGGDAKERFRVLVESLRQKPVSGRAPGASGELKTVTADPGALFTIVANAGNNYTAYRDIDAAGRAWLESGDALPLLRLVAEAIDGEDTGGPPDAFSTGLELAVECTDYVQLYDMHDSEADRHTQYEASLAKTETDDPQIYAPFRLEEATHSVANPEGLNLCQAWPRAPHWAHPGTPVPKDAKFPSVPVLVLSGELDTVTSPKEGRWTTALFPNANYLEVPNTVHESAIGDGGVYVPPFGGDLARCASPIVLSFVDSGGRMPNTSCLSEIRPVRAVPAFAASWRDVSPATAEQGNDVDKTGLTLASAAAETLGDALARYGVLLGNTDSGLRGGKFKLTPTRTGYAFDLKALKWSEDMSVSGTIDWNQLNGNIEARVDFSAGDHTGKLQLTWNDRETDAQAKIHGEIDGKTVAASRIAP